MLSIPHWPGRRMTLLVLPYPESEIEGTVEDLSYPTTTAG
jgi:hypothetical protein